MRIPKSIHPARSLGFVLTTTALMAVTGCVGFDFGDLGWNDLGDNAAEDGDVRVSRASLQGALGPTRQIDHPASAVEVDQYGDSTQVSVTVDTASGAAMTVVTLDGALEHPTLREGEQVTVYDSSNPGAQSGRVTVLGCAGPRPGTWDYDHYSDSHAVLVERRVGNPRVYTYHYVADFTDTESGTPRVTTVSGSFDVEILR